MLNGFVTVAVSRLYFHTAPEEAWPELRAEREDGPPGKLVEWAIGGKFQRTATATGKAGRAR
jgi:hypothetical protein